MASTIDICRLALSRIGVRQPIDSLTEDTPEAQACNIHFSFARQVALSSAPWTFATRRATLAQLVDVTRDGWGYAYAVPNDLLVPRSIWDGLRVPMQGASIAFSVELNDAADGRILLVDVASPILIYTADITTDGLFPPLFADALAWLLAAELSVTLSGKSDFRDQAMARYEFARLRAMAVMAGEFMEAQPERELITARW